VNQRNLGWKRNLVTVAKFAVLMGVIGYAVYYFKTMPVAVTSYTVVRDSIAAEVMRTGTLEARVKATISHKISGRIAEVLVDQGQAVTSGRLLVRLDDEDLTQRVKIAKATIATAEA
jgi:multidrug efflux pump subunit AcrA (membrane-fusion protein)